jgi:3-hydroxyisobutyrate dehydrogenase-like beta-hydroxyacid dehydrogenase
MSSGGLTVAVLGLGEAGSLLASDLLAAGVTVRGYDPAVPATGGIVQTGSEAEAAEGADIVLSVNSAKAAVDALRTGAPGVHGRAVWTDLNTASPGLKQQLAEIAAQRAITFADVAMMAPVPGRGLRVPMLACGDGAERLAAMLRPLGASVDVMAAPAGVAAGRKLLRSVFFKGMSAAIVEALAAGEAAGCADWLRQNIVDELTGADETTVDRIVKGTYQHAVRRTAEMEAATEMLTELNVPPSIADASRAVLQRIASSR